MVSCSSRGDKYLLVVVSGVTVCYYIKVKHNCAAGFDFTEETGQINNL